MEKIDYKFNEDTALEVVKQYIDKTYEQHYSKGKFQSTGFLYWKYY